MNERLDRSRRMIAARIEEELRAKRDREPFAYFTRVDETGETLQLPGFDSRLNRIGSDDTETAPDAPACIAALQALSVGAIIYAQERDQVLAVHQISTT